MWSTRYVYCDTVLYCLNEIVDNFMRTCEGDGILRRKGQMVSKSVHCQRRVRVKQCLHGVHYITLKTDFIKNVLNNKSSFTFTK